MMGALGEPVAGSEGSRRPRPARRHRAATTRRSCNAGGLKGARIGIPRAFYYDRITLNGDAPGRPEGIGPTTGITAGRGGINAAQAKVMAEAIAVLKQQGAVVVDPADVPSFVDEGSEEQLSRRGTSARARDQAKGKDENCSVNFKYGMKRDFNVWLKSSARRRR